MRNIYGLQLLLVYHIAYLTSLPQGQNTLQNHGSHLAWEHLTEKQNHHMQQISEFQTHVKTLTLEDQYQHRISDSYKI